MCEHLREALRDLYDAQPSESPIWDNTRWELAMDAARQALQKEAGRSLTLRRIEEKMDTIKHLISKEFSSQTESEKGMKRPECMFDECPISDRCDHHAACQHKGDTIPAGMMLRLLFNEYFNVRIPNGDTLECVIAMRDVMLSEMSANQIRRAVGFDPVPGPGDDHGEN